MITSHEPHAMGGNRNAHLSFIRGLCAPRLLLEGAGRCRANVSVDGAERRLPVRRRGVPTGQHMGLARTLETVAS